MKKVSFFFFVLFAFQTFAQSDSTSKDEIYEWPTIDSKAQFPGGHDSMMRYISAHIVIPTVAWEEAESGTVVVRVIVEKDGSLSNILIVSKRHIGFGVEEAVISVFKGMPKWIPALRREEPVAMKITIPVPIELN